MTHLAKSSLKPVFDQVDFFVKYSEGYFIKPWVCPNKNQNVNFMHFLRKYPNLFSVVKKCGVTLLRANDDYLEYRGNLQILGPNLEGKEILRHLVVGAACSQFGEDSLRIEPKRFVIDDFEKDYNLSDHIVLTVPHRKTEIRCRTMVPLMLQSKRYMGVLDTLYGSKMVNKDEDIASKIRVIEGGFIPNVEEECHWDEREYPGFKVPITGTMKWEMDRHNLEKGHFKEDYFFGVYPK